MLIKNFQMPRADFRLIFSLIRDFPSSFEDFLRLTKRAKLKLVVDLFSTEPKD